MTEDGRDGAKAKAERRAFLEQCGRFAAVTPPVVTLMLAVSEKSANAQFVTSRAATTTTTATTTTGGPTPLPPTLGMGTDGPAESDPTQRADTMIDSMALMKII